MAQTDLPRPDRAVEVWKAENGFKPVVCRIPPTGLLDGVNETKNPLFALMSSTLFFSSWSN